MKSERLFIIRLGDGRLFEYEGTLETRNAAGRHPIALRSAPCRHAQAVFRLGRKSRVAPLGTPLEGGFPGETASKADVWP